MHASKLLVYTTSSFVYVQVSVRSGYKEFKKSVYGKSVFYLQNLRPFALDPELYHGSTTFMRSSLELSTNGFNYALSTQMQFEVLKEVISCYHTENLKIPYQIV